MPVFLSAAGHDSNVLRGKACGQNGLYHSTGAGRIGARFDDCGISGGNRVDERIESQQKRIVPRAHDEHHAERGRLGIAAGGELRQRRTDAMLLGVGAGMAEHKCQFIQNHADFAQIAFLGAFAKILI